MDVIKIALIAITASCFGSFLKLYKQEWSMYLMFAAGILIAFCVLEKIGQFVSFFQLMSQHFGNMTKHISIIWKALGIAYICDFSSNVCKDTGNTLLADQVCICGKVAILLLGVPILLTLIQTIEGYGL